MGDEQISGIKEGGETQGNNQGGGDKEVTITYETLFEILRREKSRDELQELQASFFNDVIRYIQGKMNIISSQKNELFATDEKESALIQLQNIKKIIRELYDRREKKIINLAINKARTNSNIIDTSALLEEEKKLFDTLHNSLNNYRQGILCNLLEAKKPSDPDKEDYSQKSQDGGNIRPECSEEPDKGQDLNTSSEEQSSKADEKTVKIRFLSPVPEFVGPKLELYGPFEEGETADLPEEIADLLVSKQRAELSEQETQDNTNRQEQE